MQIIGLDLGQTTDPSACSVFTRKDFPAAPPSPLPPKPEYYGPARAEPDRSWDVIDASQAARHAEEIRRWKEMSPVIAGDRQFDKDQLAGGPKPIQTERRYLCRMLRKWPLGYSYVKVVKEVRDLCAQPRLQVDVDGVIRPPTLVIDATGVGRPIFDMFIAAKIRARLIGIVITGRNKMRQDEEVANLFYVPKLFLVNTLQKLLQARRIDFPPKLKDPVTGEDMQEALMNELKQFRQEQMTSARTGKTLTTFDAEPGSHDDVLCSAAYATWWGELGGRSPDVW